MKSIITTFIFSIMTLISSAQLKTGDKVFLQYQEVKDKKNVNGDDACQMLQSYILGKTSLIIVNSIDKSDYTFVLNVVKRSMPGERKAKITIINNTTENNIFESKWKRGTSNVYYGMSPTRHAIARVFKNQILKEFKEIKEIKK